jgi:hypothetical protein
MDANVLRCQLLEHLDMLLATCLRTASIALRYQCAKTLIQGNNRDIWVTLVVRSLATGPERVRQLVIVKSDDHNPSVIGV